LQVAGADILRLTAGGFARPFAKGGFDMSVLRPIAILSLALLLPAAALAGDDDGFGRRGVYLGVGGSYGVDFFEDEFQDAAASVGLDVSLSDTWGINARVGYRVWSWFAVEGMYEYMDNFQIEVNSVGIPELDDLVGANIDYTTHTVTVAAKFLLPIWRIHPYLSLGIGGQYYDLDAAAVFADEGLDFNESSWAFAGRPAFGIDAYITKNILINVEVGGVLATSNPSTIPDIGDLFYLSAGAGLQYRF
jgi:opacity protein-like surface antigen